MILLHSAVFLQSFSVVRTDLTTSSLGVLSPYPRLHMQVHAASVSYRYLANLAEQVYTSGDAACNREILLM
jgi:hypothetical protein